MHCHSPPPAALDFAGSTTLSKDLVDCLAYLISGKTGLGTRSPLHIHPIRDFPGGMWVTAFFAAPYLRRVFFSLVIAST